MKAITPIVVAVLLVLITISITGITFIMVMRSVENSASATQNATEKQLEQFNTNFRIDNTDNNKIYIRNTGTVNISTGNVAFYVDNQPVTATPAVSEIKPNEVAEFVLPISPGTYNLKVTVGAKTSVESISVVTVTVATTTTTMLGTTTSTTSTTIFPYAVRPVIFIGNDTSINLAAYTTQVDISFSTIRTWYSSQLNGKTFDLEPALVYRSPLTEAEIYAQYQGTSMWFMAIKNATAANGLSACDDHRFYYFVTPLENGSGGMVGAENLGCSYVLPGTAAISGHMGRLIGGIMDPGWPEWWADEVREAQGGVAHEIAHGLGGNCTIGNFVGGGCNGLPHSSGPSIMFAWWDFGTTGVFFDNEKTEILKSPFIS